MNSHTLAERLESTACRTDDKARRVLNCAPDTVAEITAEELEEGITLERLDSLNVPALRYSTQITIHGRIADFNEGARPGGYKAIFRNGNGSVGVRYAAIDAEKKRALARCAKVSQSGWHTSANSSGFEVCRYFIVRDEAQRAEQKAATLAALRSFPVSRYFGSCGVFALAYGMGYAVSANIGAIPVGELWLFCAEVFGIANAEQLAELEAAAKAAQDEKDRQWKAEHAERMAKHKAEQETRNAAKLATLAPISRVPENGIVHVLTSSGFLTVKLERSRGRDFYTITERDGVTAYDGRKLCKAGFPWPNSLAAGKVYAETVATVATPETAPTVEPRASVAKDENAPMSQRQSFALWCATGRDWRKVAGLTYGQASQALGAIQHLRGNKPAALAIVAPMLEGAKISA